MEKGIREAQRPRSLDGSHACLQRIANQTMWNRCVSKTDLATLPTIGKRDWLVQALSRMIPPVAVPSANR